MGLHNVEESRENVVNVILLSMITICEVFFNFSSYSNLHLLLLECVFISSSNIYQNKETRTQYVGILPGPKPLPLGEENPHKILLIEIPIDEYQDHDP